MLSGFREKFPAVVFQLMPHLGHDRSFLDWIAVKIRQGDGK